MQNYKHKKYKCSSNFVLHLSLILLVIFLSSSKSVPGCGFNFINTSPILRFGIGHFEN